MALMKDLGRVKGEDGNIYVPNLSIRNGKLYFEWVETEPDVNGEISPVEIPTPFYEPSKQSNGHTIFILKNGNGINNDGTALQPEIDIGDITGPQGEQGPPGQIEIYHVPSNTDITELSSDQRNVNTIYVQGSKAWIYDPSLENSENPFVMLEGMDLSGYARTEDVYTKQQINTMFNNVTAEINTIMSLFDVNE